MVDHICFGRYLLVPSPIERGFYHRVRGFFHHLRTLTPALSQRERGVKALRYAV